MAILRWVIGLLITIAISAFAVMNDEMVLITFSPVHEPISLPVYLIVLGFMAFGFIFGSIVTWLNGAKLRKTRRKQKKEIRILEKEVERLKEDKFAAQTPPAADIFPAIIAK
tara:strand:- start:44 stop:379 length:336 start_codon:yes stop_codon:yes gene_type:complete